MPISRLEPLEHPDAPKPLVQLTLYDLCTCCNGAAHAAGIGVYHSGIVIEGLEYTYDNVLEGGPTCSGVVAHAPYYEDEEQQQRMPLRAILSLGHSRISASASHSLLRSLGALWLAVSYDLVEQNCHHWCVEASSALGVQPLPRWVTRASEFMRFCSGMASQEETAAQRAAAQRDGAQRDGAQRDGAQRGGATGKAAAAAAAARRGAGGKADAGGGVPAPSRMYARGAAADLQRRPQRGCGGPDRMLVPRTNSKEWRGGLHGQRGSLSRSSDPDDDGDEEEEEFEEGDRLLGSRGSAPSSSYEQQQRAGELRRRDSSDDWEETVV